MRAKIFVLILVFTIGVVLHFLNEIDIEDEPAKINYVPAITWTSSTHAETSSMSTTTTL